jgi:hypothetical protein
VAARLARALCRESDRRGGADGLLGIDRSADTLEKIGSDVSRHDF